MHHGEEVGAELVVVAGGNSADVFQLGEEALDQVTLALEPFAEAWFPAPVDLRRNVGGRVDR